MKQTHVLKQAKIDEVLRYNDKYYENNDRMRIQNPQQQAQIKKIRRISNQISRFMRH